jgi:putative nucleotidyltransferase with HDIG domain
MAVQISISHFPTWRVLGEVKRLPLSIYLVGGAVRDLLLYGQVQDVDTLVLGDAWEAARLLASQLGGTCFQMHDDPVTLRVVMSEADLPHVDLVQIKCESEEPEKALVKDLLRRDFTVNAMAAELLQIEDGAVSLELLDPCQGCKDLSARILRTVSENALSEDPIRMLRCFRLAASLKFEIAPKALETIRESSQLIKEAAPERVREELLLLLDITPCLLQLKLALETGLICQVIPEITALKGTEQNGYHHLDVYEHTLETLRQLEEMLSAEGSGGRDWISEELMRQARFHLAQEIQPGITRRALLKMSALLHDIGKPQARTVDSSGRVRFIGHNLLGAEVAREIGRRLRLGKRPTEMLAKMVREHMRPGLLATEGSPSERAVNRFLNQMADLTVEVLLLELADRLAARGPAPRRISLEKHARFSESLLHTHLARLGETGPPRLLDGKEVMAHFKIRPGPLVGHLLALVAEAQQEGKIATKEEALSMLEGAFTPASDGLEGENDFPPTTGP